MFDISSTLEKKRWDDYVFRHVGGAFSHLFAWGETLALTYGLPLVRLAAINLQTSRICGVLPLIVFEPPGEEKRLISLPYTDAAGIIADNRESGDYLLLAALQYADKFGAAHLELRQAGDFGIFQFPQDKNCKWHHIAHDFKTGLARSLPGSAVLLWTELSPKVRNQVRKARKCGCRLKIGGSELIFDFYGVFAANMRDLGSPVHGLELFENLLSDASLHPGIIMIYQENKAVAGAIVFGLGETLFNPWASSLRSYRPFCPNMLLYWSMLEYALDHGYLRFDFGRSSPEASTCRFKLQWDADLEPLIWHVFSQGNQDWNPRRESLELEQWKSLDLESSRREGPAIRRWISL